MRLNSATEVERGSDPQMWVDCCDSCVGDSGETASVEQDTLMEDGFMVQHEQRPPNVGTPIKIYKNHLNQSFMDVAQYAFAGTVRNIIHLITFNLMICKSESEKCWKNGVISPKAGHLEEA